jgi:hypothetical protein
MKSTAPTNIVLPLPVIMIVAGAKVMMGNSLE